VDWFEGGRGSYRRPKKKKRVSYQGGLDDLIKKEEGQGLAGKKRYMLQDSWDNLLRGTRQGGEEGGGGGQFFRECQLTKLEGG